MTTGSGSAAAGFRHTGLFCVCVRKHVGTHTHTQSTHHTVNDSWGQFCLFTSTGRFFVALIKPSALCLFLIWLLLPNHCCRQQREVKFCCAQIDFEGTFIWIMIAAWVYPDLQYWCLSYSLCQKKDKVTNINCHNEPQVNHLSSHLQGKLRNAYLFSITQTQGSLKFIHN